MINDQFVIVHRSLFPVPCSLLTVPCSLFSVHCSLFTDLCSPLTAKDIVVSHLSFVIKIVSLQKIINNINKWIHLLKN